MNNCHPLLLTISQAFTAGIAQKIVCMIVTPCNITHSDVAEERVTFVFKVNKLV
jgi:hypothetical protein